MEGRRVISHNVRPKGHRLFYNLQCVLKPTFKYYHYHLGIMLVVQPTQSQPWLFPEDFPPILKLSLLPIIQPLLPVAFVGSMCTPSFVKKAFYSRFKCLGSPGMIHIRLG